MSPHARALVVTALATVMAGALVATACSDSYSGAPETAADAGVEASSLADAGPPSDPCAHARPPDAPTQDDAPGTTLPAFALAFTSNAPDAGEPGLDLDGVCTCETRPGTAHDGGESCTRPKAKVASCDRDGGVDNGLETLVDNFASFYPFGQVVGDQVSKGRSNLLIQIGDYNGAANDPDVSVALLASEGIKVQGCTNSTLEPGFDTWTPGWCGDDAWTVSPDSIIGGSVKAPVVVGHGYVRDRLLVASFVGTPRLPFTDEYAIAIVAPTITGTLVPLGEDLQPRDPARAPVGREPRLWRLDNGALAGRINVREILTGIGVTKVAVDGGVAQLCTGSSFTAFKSVICAGVDIASDPAADFGASTTCDALSAGIPFVAAPVLVGDVFQRQRKSGACDPGPNGDPLDAGSVTYGCP